MRYSENFLFTLIFKKCFINVSVVRAKKTTVQYRCFFSNFIRISLIKILHIVLNLLFLLFQIFPGNQILFSLQKDADKFSLFFLIYSGIFDIAISGKSFSNSGESQKTALFLVKEILKQTSFIRIFQASQSFRLKTPFSMPPPW